MVAKSKSDRHLEVAISLLQTLYPALSETDIHHAIYFPSLTGTWRQLLVFTGPNMEWRCATVGPKMGEVKILQNFDTLDLENDDD